MAEERLQKLLARAGHGSRRSAEALVRSGRVRVNNVVVTELGAKADPDRDLVTLDGTPLEVPDTRRTFAFYKPERVVTTMRDPEGRPCVGDFVGSIGTRVFPVGRLDWDAEGLLLLTSDGELAHRLMHPRWGVKRTYVAKVRGDPSPEVLQRLVAGVKLDDGDGRAIEASFERATDKNAWIKLVVKEGRNHFVKRLCEAIGHPVLRLFRIEYAGVRLGTLKPGRHRELQANEVRELLAATADESPRPPPPGARREGAPRAAGDGPRRAGRGGSGGAARPHARPAGAPRQGDAERRGDRPERKSAGSRGGHDEAPRGERDGGPRGASPRAGRPTPAGARPGRPSRDERTHRPPRGPRGR